MYYADLRSQIHAEMTDVRSGENLFDSVVADITIEGQNVKVDRVVALRKENTFTASGTYLLPDDLTQFRTQPAGFNVTLGAVELGDYWPEDSPNRITGPVQVSGEVTVTDGKADGELSIYGSNLKFRTVTIPEISGQASISRNVVYLNDFTAKLNERDYIAGSGVFSLDAPHAYSGRLSANVADLARMKPLLAAFGNNNDIAGSLVVDWEGSGEVVDFKNSGKLKLTLEKGRYANLQALQANIEADYSPEGLNVPTIFLGSDKLSFQAIMTAKDATLEVSKIQIDQGQAKYAAGYIALPFVWKNLGTERPLFPSDGKVLITFQSENLDLKKLFADLGRAAARHWFDQRETRCARNTRSSGRAPRRADARPAQRRISEARARDVRSRGGAEGKPARLQWPLAAIQNPARADHRQHPLRHPEDDRREKI